MSAQLTLKGYTVNYDDESAVVLAGGHDVANFATNDDATAQVQALRWIKTHGPATVENDKGVSDGIARDDFGNVIDPKAPKPPEPFDDSET